MTIKKRVATKVAKVDRLFENFASELVTILMDKDIEISSQSEEMIQTQKMPMSASGYLTDVDDQYIYLGHAPNGIHQAIRKEYIIHIEITEAELDEGDMMEIGQIPKGMRGFN